MRFRGGEFSTGTTGNFQPELTMPTQITLGAPMRVRCHGRIQRCELKAGDTAGMAMAIEKYEFLARTEDAAKGGMATSDAG
jgi:hypothetical protein